jgi:hypothetical protein
MISSFRRSCLPVKRAVRSTRTVDMNLRLFLRVHVVLTQTWTIWTTWTETNDPSRNNVPIAFAIFGNEQRRRSPWMQLNASFGVQTTVRIGWHHRRDHPRC